MFFRTGALLLATNLCATAGRIERGCCAGLLHAIGIHCSRTRCLEAVPGLFSLFQPKGSFCELFVHLIQQHEVHTDSVTGRRYGVLWTMTGEERRHTAYAASRNLGSRWNLKLRIRNCKYGRLRVLDSSSDCLGFATMKNTVHERRMLLS